MAHPSAEQALPLSLLEASEDATVIEDQERPLDQLAVGCEGPEQGWVVHGLHGGSTERAVTLAACVEQALTTQLLEGTGQFLTGGWLTRDVDQIKLSS